MPNQQLANELHKPIYKKFKRRKVNSSFKNIIWDVDLVDMQLISKYNKEIRYILCVIDIFSKYAWVVPLKDKKGVTTVNAFQSILDNSKRRPNKIWIDQGSEFYNSHFKKWLKDNDIKMYSTHNAGKSVVAVKFIRSLENNIYKWLLCQKIFDVLDDIVHEYNNIYHRTIKVRPIDVKSDCFAEYNEEFKVGDHVTISKCFTHIFAKGYTPNLSEEIFVISKIKYTVPWTCIINDLNGEEIVGTLYEKELQKTNQKEFRIEKIIKRKANKLYVKWKGYDNSFNIWIDKKDTV